MDILFTIICFPGDVVFFVMDFFPDYFVWFAYASYILVCIAGLFTREWKIFIPTFTLLFGYTRSMFLDKMFDKIVSSDISFLSYSDTTTHTVLLWIASVSIFIYMLLKNESRVS